MNENHNPMDPNATPDFDEWGWDTYWSRADWLTWLNALNEAYGSQAAAQKFYTAWASRSGFIETFGDVRGDWIAFDTSFRAALAEFTLPGGANLLDAIEGTVVLGEVMGGGSEAINEVGGAIGSAGTGIKNLGDTLRWVLPAALVVVVIIGAIYLLKPLKLIS